MKTRLRRLRAAGWIVFYGAVLLFALDDYCIAAQSPGSTETDGRGMVWYENVSGFSNQSGEVFKLDTTLGYKFRKHFELDAGIPVYFIRASPVLRPPNAVQGTKDDERI